ncbi:M20 family metallopeptidase [Pseudomonas sp. CCI3.2]|uniref:M20 family metallopeptidase n=1 Tax=unclassified Pseudomonas TaxID=196821 RepID=UPI002AC91B32|nr:MULTISPECIES: M20 family metallopeptidase [unclassified Pseudomonas]MEB0078548.1 M20 family metallopeptidase [Pseudomonas sp. MH10out]MEB0092152.1 M20 family metallopeptidase [Pseudomonas sp. CCI4.2]MEB0100363.1 M20 family metallopeptidase [Pseudomonas sp. CCI3.2]MEB0132822.1 M20 family metallopeptidase [Pseudomonas sp. CCI2.4]MEB0159127.1 M20 family metallopeptidase [Pseudomonas sp. AH2 (2023)]
MSKPQALASVRQYLSDGHFAADLRRRIAIRSESQDPDQAPELARYLDEEIAPALMRMGFECQSLKNPKGAGPLLFASRIEGEHLPTVLTYGHGDVVLGYDEQWREGLSPWALTIEGDRWYGRGTADNKGQHSINLTALEQVIKAREGRLGFNVKVLFETGEECGSPGLREVCEAHQQLFKADVFIASDGPRLNDSRPTLFLGSRGSALFSLQVNARDKGLHSGNWGGVMSNPAVVLSNALASLVDQNGRIRCRGLVPCAIPNSVRAAIHDLGVDEHSLGLTLDVQWGEPGLTLGEKLFGWNTLEILAFTAGNPAKPVNAIPPSAIAYCQLRFVLGTDWQKLESLLRQHLDAEGFHQVNIVIDRCTPATRLDPDNQWVRFAKKSIADTTPRQLAVLPNLAGTLPNDIFSDVLGLPTVWIPHSYPGCSQHAPDEHMLGSVILEGLEIMTALFWDLGHVA